MSRKYLPGQKFIWEGQIYVAGPSRKDWSPHTFTRNCPLFYSRPWYNTCGECASDRCGTHIAGCVLRPGIPDDSESYWAIRPQCKQWHGES